MTDALRLVMCSSPEFRDRLGQGLGETYRLEGVETSLELAERLEEERPAALLIDPERTDPSDDDMVRVAHQARPDLPIALIVSTRSSACYSYLQTYGLGAAIPADAPLSPRPLKAFLDHFIEPEPRFGLDPYFPPNRRIERRRIDTPVARGDVLKELVNEFRECDYIVSHDLQVIFEETLVNAISHAFRTERNIQKYEEDAEKAFDVHDEIHVEWAVDRDLAALSITDNQGLLAPRAVWERFSRHSSMEGLLDSRGRGLYLTHLLSRQILVTIAPGMRTQIAVFFAPGPVESEKPIGIRVATRSARTST
ncbi:hypothetical protein JW916_00230 [Candidatus Sumerlaeota bacterium]|nr:hypothetical protein [Candidatus Sumerlaeota bacterium]